MILGNGFNPLVSKFRFLFIVPSESPINIRLMKHSDINQSPLLVDSGYRETHSLKMKKR